MSIAFKEWEVICNALASGRQTILLRKGGIHEGREGFSFAHESFCLFPTKFHAQNDHVREGRFVAGKEWETGDEFTITHHAEAVVAATLTDWRQVEQLLPYHIYTPATLKERFDWEGKGMSSGSIHVALVRVRKLREPLALTYGKTFGGCRSWVEIPAGDPEGAVPVIEENSFAKVRAEIVEILSAKIAS